MSKTLMKQNRIRYVVIRDEPSLLYSWKYVWSVYLEIILIKTQNDVPAFRWTYMTQ